MKRVLILVLLLMLVLGSACADTESTVLEYEVLDAEAAYEDLEWVAVDSYEGKTIDWTGQPFVVREYVDEGTGLTNWDIDWADEESYDGWVYRFAPGWFQGFGIIAEGNYDLDGDGADEKIVLSSELLDEMAFAVRVYEYETTGLEYADGAYLTDGVDFCGYNFKAFLTEIDSKPRFVFFDGEGIDGTWHYIWTISYQNEKLAIDQGMHYVFYGDGDGPLLLLNDHVPIDALYILGDHDLFGIYVEEEGGEAGITNEELEKFARKMGLTYKFSSDPWHQEIFSLTDEVVLFNVNNRARDAEGNPILRIQRAVPSRTVTATASVNLRAEPGLDGEIVAAVEADTSLLYLGEESTDDRGVVWYKVMHENQPCWVSSKYAALN